MQSMTGFGSTKVTSSPWVFYIQVKSVNSRFLDLKLNIPPFFSSLEGDLRSQLQSHFSRGSIELYLRAELQELGVAKLPTINVALTRHYLESIRKAHAQLGFGKSRPQVTWADLLRLPDAIRFDSPQELTSAQKKSLIKGVRQAALNCQKERMREGVALRAHLSLVLSDLKSYLKQIKKITKSEARDLPNEAYRERVKAFLEKKGITFSEERLTEEWAYFRERSAIFEELERLESHMDHFVGLFDAVEPVGKRLDFYTQELLREFNTIGSKTNQVQVTQLVVESKSLIERLKEQVQNIE